MLYPCSCVHHHPQRADCTAAARTADTAVGIAADHTAVVRILAAVHNPEADRNPGADHNPEADRSLAADRSPEADRSLAVDRSPEAVYYQQAARAENPARAAEPLQEYRNKDKKPRRRSTADRIAYKMP